MRNFLSLLTSFRSSNKPSSATHSIPQEPITVSKDLENAKLFLSTLFLLLPDENMQKAAFDDYHPSVFYAIKELENGTPFLQQFEEIKIEIKLALDQDDLAGFEKVLDDNAEAFSTLKFLMLLPGGAYKGMTSRIFTNPAQPIFEDVKTNTRYSSWLHNEGVTSLIDRIEALEVRTGLVSKSRTQAPEPRI